MPGPASFREAKSTKMLNVEFQLRRVTRKIAFVRGGARLIEPIRRHYVSRYAASPQRWTEIGDFDGDMKLRVDRAAYMGSLIYWRGYHSYRELRVLDRLLTPAMTFIDVGANRGEFTVFAAKRLPSGRVLSFEPLPDNFRELTHNIKLNHLDNVTPFAVGLADSSRRQSLYTSADESVHQSWNEGLGSLFASDYRAIELEPIELRTLDEVCSDAKLSTIHCIKIDVEGAELSVLHGAHNCLLRFRPVLILESNAETCRSAGYSIHDIAHLLEPLGYQPHAIDRRGKVAPLALAQMPDFCSTIWLPPPGFACTEQHVARVLSAQL
jgi:FkbM family methyltransferase